MTERILIAEDDPAIADSVGYSLRACGYYVNVVGSKYGGGLAAVPPCDLAATIAILVVKALYELRRTGGRYALVTMCIGGGQGIAAVFERI